MFYWKQANHLKDQKQDKNTDYEDELGASLPIVPTLRRLRSGFKAL